MNIPIICSKQNPKIKQWKKWTQKPSLDHLLLVGEDLLRDNAGYFVPKILFSSHQETLQQWHQHYRSKYEPELYRITKSISTYLTGLPSFEGICAIVKIAEQPFPQTGKFLCLDGIQDPGNMGTIIRSCSAFDWQGIFYTKQCCCPYQQKVIRASRGLGIQLPLKKIKPHELLAAYPATSIFVTKRSDFTWPPKRIPASCIVVVGHEGKGPLFPWPEECPGLWIPTCQESLNVACATTVILYSFGNVQNNE